MTTANTDIETIVSEPIEGLTLVSGTPIKVNRLRTREMMALLRILTRGAADVLGNLVIDENTTQADFAGTFVAGIVLAIPEAEEETINFLNVMVTHADLKEGVRLTKQEIAANIRLEEQLREELRNPELEDTVTIISEVIKTEAPHMIALGKQLGVLIRAQQMNANAKQGGSSKRSSRG